MSRFKEGDLALIIGSSGRHPETVGMCVELTKKVHFFNGPGWHWKGCPARGTREIYLMPLRDDFTSEQSKQQERPVNA